jgi:hypothetical protein
MIIKRVAPFSCAKVVGAIYASFWLLFACLSSIIYLISMIARIFTGGSLPPSSGVPAQWFGLPIGIAFPILYGLAVFLAALIGAWLYNALAGVFGGIEVEVE